MNTTPVKPTILAIGSAVSFAVCMVVNALGGVGYIGVATNSELSAKYPTPFTPIGWTFSIWGFIFLFQACWASLFFFSTLCSSSGGETNQLVQDPNAPKRLTTADYGKALGWWLPGVWVFEILWTFAFNYDVIWLSLIFMYGVLLCVALSFFKVYRLATYEVQVSGGCFQGQNGYTFRDNFKRLVLLWTAVIPTAVNFGWICVASSVNLFTCITLYAGVESGAVYIYPNWAINAGVVVLVVLTIVASILSLRQLSAALAFTVVWSMSGVAAAATTAPLSTVLLVARFSSYWMAAVGVMALLLPYFPSAAQKVSCGAFHKPSNSAEAYQELQGESRA